MGHNNGTDSVQTLEKSFYCIVYLLMGSLALLMVNTQ